MSDRIPTQEEKDAKSKLGIINQPDPVANDNPSSHDLVIADMEARKAFGFQKYGTYLQAGNGRDALQDAYEEILDAAVYLRTLIEERNEG